LPGTAFLLDTKRKQMAKVSRNWNRMNREERVAFAAYVLAKLKGDPHFETTNPVFTALQTCFVRARDAIAEARDLENKLANVRARRDGAVDALMVALEAGADAVERSAERNAEKIAATGFEPVGSVMLPPVMTQVINFSVSAGDFEGELDVHWDAVRGASIYDVQICTANPESESNWRSPHLSGTVRTLSSTADPSDENKRPGVNRTKATLTDLPSGKRVWVRACAVGRDSSGPWSEPHSKVVP
jgi:hypothetical protein